MNPKVSLLFDHNMPPAIAKAVHEIIKLDDCAAFNLRDRFKPNIDDISYFNELGKQGNWIVVSKDLQNSKKKAERATILQNNILAFYLSPSLQKKYVSEQAAAILWHWPKILQTQGAVQRGLFQLPENKGKFKQL